MHLIFKPFTDLATYLRRKRREDPFLYARVTTALFYFGAMFVAITLVNLVLDSVISGIVREALSSARPITPDEVTARINQARWIARCLNIVVFTSIVYLLLGHTLRPIQRLVESQRQFIANVSHELKTPLTVAKTEIEVALRRPEELTPAAVALLSETNERMNHLSRIIQFFSVIADVTAKHPSTTEEVVRLREAAETVVYDLKAYAASRAVTVTIVDHALRGFVRGNRLALERMLLNLVRNALAHSDPGGVVTVSIGNTGQQLVLEVADTGSGIPKSDQDRIFEPFYRASNAVPGGSGLGLAIVGEVARLHGAQLTLVSEEGAGTTIKVTFRSMTPRRDLL